MSKEKYLWEVQYISPFTVELFDGTTLTTTRCKIVEVDVGISDPILRKEY